MSRWVSPVRHRMLRPLQYQRFRGLCGGVARSAPPDPVRVSGMARRLYVWTVSLSGKTFTMLSPDDETYSEALADVRARWPGATVMR